MPEGGGKYDDQATIARNSCEAVGVALIVFGGKHGNGFSVQAPMEVQVALPMMLENMAESIRRDLKEMTDVDAGRTGSEPGQRG